jgi:hypothetical protein
MMLHHYINVFLTSASYVAGKQVRSAAFMGCNGCIKGYV